MGVAAEALPPPSFRPLRGKLHQRSSITPAQASWSRRWAVWSRRAPGRNGRAVTRGSGGQATGSRAVLRRGYATLRR